MGIEHFNNDIDRFIQANREGYYLKTIFIYKVYYEVFPKKILLYLFRGKDSSVVSDLVMRSLVIQALYIFWRYNFDFR